MLFESGGGSFGFISGAEAATIAKIGDVTPPARRSESKENSMAELKEQWNLEMALEVLGNKTVAGSLWSEAVKWLLLYGPPELRELLASASAAAFASCFPGVRVKGHGDSGQPFYALGDLAGALGVPVVETTAHLAELQSTLGVEFLVEADRVYLVN